MILRLFIKTLMLPPAFQFILAGLAWYWWQKKPRLAKSFLMLSVISLYLLSTPLVAKILYRSIETYPAITPITDWKDDSMQERPLDGVQAIVILGGNRNSYQPEYGKDISSAAELERLRYGARLHKASGVPILVSAGIVFDEILTEAELMQDVLENDFSVPVKWLEDKSRTTWENAQLSYAMLNEQGITRVAVVTHAWHMPRTVYAFEQAGFDVLAAPTIFRSQLPLYERVTDVIPDAGALGSSRSVLHEWLGLLWYRVG